MATETKQNNLVEKTRQDFAERLEELAPLVQEHEQITALLAQMDQAREGRRSGRGRRRAGNTRADEFLKLVSDNPGITVADAAKEMGIGPNYLYRVARELSDDDKLVKDGSGYKVKANAKSNGASKSNAKTKDKEEAAPSK